MEAPARILLPDGLLEICPMLNCWLIAERWNLRGALNSTQYRSLFQQSITRYPINKKRARHSRGITTLQVVCGEHDGLSALFPSYWHNTHRRVRSSGAVAPFRCLLNCRVGVSESAESASTRAVRALVNRYVRRQWQLLTLTYSRASRASNSITHTLTLTQHLQVLVHYKL